MIYGYARVSSKSQKFGIQIEALVNYGVDEIIKETVTGISEEKKLNDLIDKMKNGDTIVVTRMDRLGRSTRQLLELTDELKEREIGLVMLDFDVDTTTPMGEFFLASMSAISELDRKQSRIKIMAGVQRAKREGRYKGRKRKFKLKNNNVQEALKMYDEDRYTVDEICEITKMSRATFYRRLKEREAVKNDATSVS